MPQPLDLTTSFLCGWTALLFFGLFSITGPKRTIWKTWPLSVRLGLLACGVTFMLRAVNLTAISSTVEGAGHINLWGLAATCALSYTMTTMAHMLVTAHLPDRWWERIAWLEGEAKTHPHSVPVMTTMAEISGTAAVKGATALPPHAGGEDLLKALERNPTEH